MIDVGKLEKLGKAKEEENNRFRLFLKTYADEQKLDQEFKELHEKYFSIYDCSKCRNCCKKLGISLQEDELIRICNHYNYDIDGIKDELLIEKYGEYVNKKNPCPFLNKDNECNIKECLAKSCKDYPYTNKEERLYSLLTIVQNSKICPVVYEILEELKRKYKFRR